MENKERISEITLCSLEDTKNLAIKLSALFRAGDVVCLEGPIGAGKTTLTQFLLRELGIQGDINSPTFAIVIPYKTEKFPVYHSDVYRIEDEEELYNIGFEDYFREDSLLLVEWADTIMDYLEELSDRLIKVKIEPLSSGNRVVRIDWYDDRRDLC